MIQQVFTTTCIGDIARQIISQDQAGKVLGVTSRGIFLLFPSSKATFLSYEAYKGPLTFNLGAASVQFDRLSPGVVVQVHSRNLYFDSANICILNDEAAVWQTPMPVGAIQPVIEINKQLASISRQLMAQKRASEISSLLPHILGFSSEFTGIQTSKFSLQQIQGFLQAIESHRPSLMITHLESLLGYGAGLTPSGDDLAIGFLLTLNRWGKNLVSEIELQRLNRSVVQSARQKTTALSASLIECAANGDANERLIQALDGIMTGFPGPEKCAKLLLSWGNSSGGDALTGMVLAICLLDLI